MSTVVTVKERATPIPLSTPKPRTAREKFAKGDRVCLSRLYLSTFRPKNPERLSAVVGFGLNPACVRILPDGQHENSAATFHMDYFEVVE